MNVLNAPTPSVFFRYASFSVLGMLAITSAGIIDGYFVGNYVGAEGLAAINIVLPIFSLLVGLSLMLAIGGSVVSGKFLAQNNTLLASIMLSKTVLSAALVAILLCTLLGTWLTPLLLFLGANADLLPLSKAYIGLLLFFLPFLMVGITLDHFTRTDNRPSLAFYALLASSVLNIILDWLLVVHLDYGLQGAAFATGFSHLLLVAILLPVFIRRTSGLRFVKPFGANTNVFRAAYNGLSEFVNESSIAITTLLFNLAMLHHFDTAGVAAFSVITYLLWIGLMAIFGVCDALQPLVSKNYGARHPKRIEAFLRLGGATVLGIGLIFSLFLIAIPEYLTALFLNKRGIEAHAIALEFALFIWPIFLFNGFNLLVSAYFTAIQKPRKSTTIAFLRSLVFPLIFILALPKTFGVTGIFIALPLAEFCTFFIALFLLLRHTPKKVLEAKA
ncbi:MATE family efflux transporter [Sulfurospirillum sp. T05]|uniref:Multidrug export protein MepA n=1 Tax=Sulfurospirillum tamanense TaxID=2813362 RepID=A0ABS2WRR1_9BACT|nr:MATE family efflux transporter [Sulfurospirillum tamanensis]MBN2964088.1 MATE family efflux transporter [Sulfurospirillum tamanensis]